MLWRDTVAEVHWPLPVSGPVVLTSKWRLRKNLPVLCLWWEWVKCGFWIVSHCKCLFFYIFFATSHTLWHQIIDKTKGIFVTTTTKTIQTINIHVPLWYRLLIGVLPCVRRDSLFPTDSGMSVLSVLSPQPEPELVPIYPLTWMSMSQWHTYGHNHEFLSL